MKIAFYSDAGRDQVILTPETDYEKAILNTMHEGGVKTSVHKGGFYSCNGGWTRQRDNVPESTIIVLDREVKR